PNGRKAIAEVYGDFSPVNGSSVSQLYDDGTHGDKQAGDSVYTGEITIPDGAPTGAFSITFTAKDIDGKSATVSSGATGAVLSFTVDPGTNGAPGGTGATGGNGTGVVCNVGPCNTTI